MKICPDKENSEYKKLVAAFGSKRANTAFYRKGDGSIPTVGEAESLLGIKANSETFEKKRWDDWVKNEPITRKTVGQEITQGLSGVLDKIKEVTVNAVRSVNPTFLEKENYGSMAETILRKNLGATQRKNELADKSAMDAMRFWNRKTYNEQMHFIRMMENPELYDVSENPELAELVNLYRTRLDKVFDEVSSIKDVPYYEDYFPHFWKDTRKATSVFTVLQKRPLEGGKSFLKKRFYEDVQAGMDAGLELITTNPEELVRIAEMNATKFTMAHDIFNDFQSSGMLQYARAGEKTPEGWELVKDKLFERMAPFAEKVSAEEVAKAAEEGEAITPEAGITRGGWYMPEDAARVVNNYLSRGMTGTYWGRHGYKAAMYVNNMFNMVQLGFSQFHLVTTSLDASVTTAANGLNKLLSLNPKLFASGIYDVAKGFTILPAVADNYAKAHSTKKAYYGGKMPVEVQRIVNANGRMSTERAWQINAEYAFDKSFNRLLQGEIRELPSALGNGLASIIEITAKPAMKYNVPAMKIGGFMKTFETEVALRPNMTNYERTKLGERVWDNQDDRLGQVVYDNMFWNKMLKDLSFTTIRSFGWTGGTIRAIGKGIRDVPESAVRLTKGEGLAPTTAWLASLGMMVGVWGGIYHYLMTGNPPEEIKDYYYPKDGTKNPDGTDRRVSLPTYVKDMGAYYKNPYQTAWNKTSPFVNIWHDIYTNQDFYRQPIRDVEDPFYKQGLDIGEYMFKTITPFAFKQQPGEERGFFERLKTKEGIEAQFGIIKAPSELTRTELEETINLEFIKEADKQRRGKDYKPEQSIYKKVIAAQLREGKHISDMTLEEKQKAGLVNKYGQVISPQKIADLVKSAKLTNAQRSFSYLSPEGQMRVISKLNDEQFNELKSAKRIFKRKGFSDLVRNKPEFFNTKELKDAYKRVTGVDFEKRVQVEEKEKAIESIFDSMFDNR